MAMASHETNERPLVLVVDDDADLRALTQLRLVAGFDVLQAADGVAALDIAETQSPDVILLDIMMPGMSGRDVIKALAQNSKTENIPVIFLSALGGLEDRVRGLESGAVDFIVKSVDPAELFARVAAAARRGRSQIPPSDQLTNLEGRNRFDARMRAEVARSARSNAALSVLILDVDQMDELNDAIGRHEGDRILGEIADSLRSTLRISDVLFRYGGDEFAVILPDTDVGTAYFVAERCRSVIHEIPAGEARVVVSIGVAELSQGRSAEELIAKTEIALFRAKESGGDRSWRSDDPRRHGLNPIALSGELTEREWDVLRQLASQRTEQEIARRLGIRPGTVRSHKARIRRKLHVAPHVRLGDFARNNFKDLVERLGQGAVPA